MTTPLVLILMGSDSDWEVMSEARKALDDAGRAQRGPRLVGPPDARRGPAAWPGRRPAAGSR